VFCAGLLKLWWAERRSKKHAIVDEEKRRTIEELRKTGQLVERKRPPEVPFGVRAIESGIEVDGIWISKSATPVSESLRAARAADSSNNSSGMSSYAGTIGSDVSRAGSFTRTPLAPIRGSWTETDNQKLADTASTWSTPISSRLDHRPRRSSQLRFSSYGDMHFDQETVGRLEGVLPTKLKPDGSTDGLLDISQPLNADDPASEVSVEADRISNSSAGSERTASTSSNGKVIKHGSRQYRPVYSQTAEEAQARADAAESVAAIERTNSGDYFSIPYRNPMRERLDPFRTPGMSPARTPASNSSSEGGVDSDMLFSPEHPEYGPGGVHVNKTARKVNSAFEVLPAGTFGAEKEMMTNNPEDIGLALTSPAEAETSKDENNPFPDGKRSSRKLQKNPRSSSSRSKKSASNERA
jgi:hypothetical protein